MPLTSAFPPVLPIELANIKLRTFFDINSEQKKRLIHSFKSNFISALEDYFNAFRRQLSPSRGSQIIGFQSKGFDGLKSAWEPYGETFVSLRTVLKRLTTVLPGTATVKSEYSLLGREETNEQSKIS